MENWDVALVGESGLEQLDRKWRARFCMVASALDNLGYAEDLWQNTHLCPWSHSFSAAEQTLIFSKQLARGPTQVLLEWTHLKYLVHHHHKESLSPVCLTMPGQVESWIQDASPGPDLHYVASEPQRDVLGSLDPLQEDVQLPVTFAPDCTCGEPWRGPAHGLCHRNSNSHFSMLQYINVSACKSCP